ncbi:prolipoprotein diacylglyceryl transferase [Candidatus Peribacteria bacterium]|nr:prolipoprotein diacylglyceryl transferase [Candidatus Peribacteria bacterium]
MLSLFPSRAVAISVFGFDVHWYGLLYLAGFLVAYLLLPRLQKYRGLSLDSDAWGDILAWGVLGVLLGGRLGYVLFYDPGYYLMHPLEVLAVWKGGMASHGGFIGVILSLIFSARKHKISLLALGDIVVVPVAIGLALGRLGNFINQELYGIPTTLPWGIAIPGVEGLRHPTQLYAVLKDLFIAGVCFLHLRLPMKSQGQTAGIFLILYGVLRFALEFLREPTHTALIIGPMILTRGQVYSVPIVIGGLFVLYFGRKPRVQ